jgi:hypothetical protein
MFARRSTAVGVALLCALALALAAGGAGSASAVGGTVTPTWGAVQQYQTKKISLGEPNLLFKYAPAMYSVACPSTGTCVAAGASHDLYEGADHAPVIAVESRGRWGAPVAVRVPGTVVPSTQSLFASVACSSASSCVAVGFFGGQALAVPFTVSGSRVILGTARQVALPSNDTGGFLTGVSCSSTCTAVGTFQNSSGVWTAMTATPGAGGAWTAKAVAAPAGAKDDSVLNAISCPSSGACEAVGSYADAQGTLHGWIVPVSGGTAGTSRAVTDAAFAPLPAEAPQPGAGLQAGLAGVSCPSSGACTIVGTFGTSASTIYQAFAAPVTHGAVGSFTKLSGLAAVSGLSCPDTGDCVAVGVNQVMPTNQSATAAGEVGGTWSPAITPSNPLATFAGRQLSLTVAEGVACASAAACVMTGSESVASFSSSAFLDYQGSFFAYFSAPLAITTTKLPAGKVGVHYKATLESSGGLGALRWATTTGSLPAGLRLDASTGEISGTPTKIGRAAFVITATSSGLSSTAKLSITVAAVSSKVRVKHSNIAGHIALLTLSCSLARCTGKYKLTTKIANHTVRLANGHYALTPGSTDVIDIHLRHRGLALLHKLGKLTGKLTLTPTGANKPALTKVLRFKN